MVIVAVGSGVLGLGIGVTVVSSATVSNPLTATFTHADPPMVLAVGDITAAPATTVLPPTTTPPTTTPPTTTPPTTTPPTSAARATATDGSLSATAAVTTQGAVAGSPVSFVVSVTDSAARGPVGPESITYGDGQPVPETGVAASCRAGAAATAVSESFDSTHTYASAGVYTLTVAVSSPCSSEHVAVTLPVTIGA
jgi:hypothetical protein